MNTIIPTLKNVEFEGMKMEEEENKNINENFEEIKKSFVNGLFFFLLNLL